MANNKDVNIVIEVSQDKYEAYVTLVPLTESPVFSVDEIREELSHKGITFGIKEDVLALLQREMKYNEKLLIASGAKPKAGRDGFIRYSFEINETAKVKKGEKVGEIIPPEEGVEGVSVFEDKIPPKEKKKAKVPKLINVEFSPENENILISRNDGYILIDKSTAKVTPFFELEELVNQYEAYITVKKPLHKGDFNSEDLKRYLSDNNIVHGILEEKIKNIFKLEKFDERILVARGEKVVNGKDGKIKYYFDTEVKPREDKRGNVNFKELNLVHIVKKGDKLAEIFPPEKGTEGCTIFGKKIPPKEGKPIILPSGKNTHPDLNNPNILLAKIDGHVLLKGKNIQVEPVFIVKGDVDFSTGNIDYIGSVIVNGDVKSGFSIKAKNDVQVSGVVEDAVIEAGGNVLLKTGFIGKNEGKITAQGNVMVKFCENEHIICDGDIYIDEYVMHSTIQARGNLIVMDKKGLIVGGEIYAVKGIEVKIIGNRNYTSTNIFAGVDKDINDKIKEKREFLVKNEENKKEIEKAINKIMPSKFVMLTLPKDKKILLDKLNKVKDKLEEEEKELTAEIDKLESALGEFKHAVIKILDVVYPGTSITIYNRHLKVEEPMKYVFYKYTEKDIVAADLSELK